MRSTEYKLPLASSPPNLPLGVGRNWVWQQEASCRNHPKDLFFPPDIVGRRRSRTEEARAKQICSDCPVLHHCRDYALQAPEAYGIWGAMTPQERARVLLARDIARGRVRIDNVVDPWPSLRESHKSANTPSAADTTRSAPTQQSRLGCDGSFTVVGPARPLD
ncbi:MAG: hypothetical protein DI630_12075 [Gordonia sp. (in: high G+C Gram-positive bacteria)]|nr:MAG: hypothetical protein DI630_12075 [Gordonia sp. (in: high G+C Gram-positive bacteria)]